MIEDCPHFDSTTKWASSLNTGGGWRESISRQPTMSFDLIFFIQVFKTHYRQKVKTLDSVSCGTICTVGGAMEARFNKNTEFFKYNNFKQPLLNIEITDYYGIELVYGLAD